MCVRLFTNHKSVMIHMDFQLHPESHLSCKGPEVYDVDADLAKNLSSYLVANSSGKVRDQLVESHVTRWDRKEVPPRDGDVLDVVLVSR